MFVKVSNDQPSQYPYNIRLLRQDHPNVSLQSRIPAEGLPDFGVFPVSHGTKPTITFNQRLDETNPVLSNGEWVRNWNVVELTAAEIAEKLDYQERTIRLVRDNKLKETDWWASSDLTMTADQVTYRQALRDITSHANFPHIEEADWPVKP